MTLMVVQLPHDCKHSQSLFLHTQEETSHPERLFLAAHYCIGHHLLHQLGVHLVGLAQRHKGARVFEPLQRLEEP